MLISLLVFILKDRGQTETIHPLNHRILTGGENLKIYLKQIFK